MAPKPPQQSVDPDLDSLRWVASSASFRPLILRLDDELAPDLSNLQDLTALMPLSVWAALIAEPERYLLRAQEFLPSLPGPDVQVASTGKSGGAMLAEVIGYCRLLEAAAGPTRMSGPVVEFGAGWGRISRLLMRSVPQSRYVSLDPFKRSIQIAEASGWGGRVARCKIRLETDDLPAGASLVFASQLFMRISREAFVHDLHALSACLGPGGLLMVSVRMPEFWLLPDRSDPDRANATARDGINHEPGEFADLGETAVSTDWMIERFADIGLSEIRIDWVPDQSQVVHVSGIR